MASLDDFDRITKARGIIVDYAIEVEQALNDVLCQYITEDKQKRDQLLEFFRKEQITFGMKIIMLTDFDVHRQKSYGDTFKGLTGKLMRMQEIRNSLAHQRRDPLESYIIVKTQSGLKKTLINESFVFGFVKEAQETIKKLKALQSLIEVEGPTSIEPPDKL